MIVVLGALTPPGVTPFAEPLPIPRGVLTLKLELEDYETRYIMARNPGPMFNNLIYLEGFGNQFPIEEVTLFPPGKIPLDMVEVPASNLPLFVTGWSRKLVGSDLVVPTPQFAVSRFEVTNAEYKEFVDKDGYRNPAYWDGLQFVDGNLQLSFEDAMSRFVDTTGRHGPAGWALGNFEPGESKLPVGGVSWYEAVAYSRFRRLALPTIYHWTRYALGPLEGLYPVGPALSLASNFNQTGLLPAKNPVGIGPWGTYHTSGNVREWIWNSAEGLGLAQGESWQGYGGASSIVTTVPRMNRRAGNGIRLIQHIETGLDEKLMGPIDLVSDDPYARREPASDEAFEIMQAQFTPPKRKPTEVSVVRVRETDHWVVDEHRLKFSEDETLVLYIFTPTTGKAPFQTVVYGPDGSAVLPGQMNRDAVAEVAHFQDILRGGRAVVVPIWAGTFELAVPNLWLPELHAPYAVLWYRNVVDTVNYIASREELSADVAYMGYSFGAGFFGNLLLALETRLKTGILMSGGLVHYVKLNPLLDGIHYTPRIHQPILMLNGKFDHIHPWVESSQRMLQLLGTPAEHKKLVGYDAGHIDFEHNEVVSEIGNWLDKYLGPVH